MDVHETVYDTVRVPRTVLVDEEYDVERDVDATVYVGEDYQVTEERPRTIYSAVEEQK